jgi:hypothetical protein
VGERLQGLPIKVDLGSTSLRMDGDLEVRPVTGEELGVELRALLEQKSDSERKCQMQVGRKDVEFDVD